MNNTKYIANVHYKKGFAAHHAAGLIDRISYALVRITPDRAKKTDTISTVQLTGTTSASSLICTQGAALLYRQRGGG